MNTQGSKGQIYAIFCKSIDVIIAYHMRAILTRSWFEIAPDYK